jgi:mannose-6-phosphate isomerase-like protein (cupin superfamily)
VGFDVADVHELPAEGPGGMVRKARRAVGARAFGFNYFVFPPDQAGLEHEHGDDGHEEVVFVVAGSGVLHVDGEQVELRPGRLVRIDPESTRRPVSGPDGLEFLTIGGPQQGAYEPPSWG